MAYCKIVKVNRISNCVNYVLRDDKTNGLQYVTGHDCNPLTAASEFEITNWERRAFHNTRPFSVESWMIIQSFEAGETTSETAHKVGVELAKSYLGDGHQYIVSTHIDSKCIHNHIVFCATDRNTWKSFNSKTEHIIDDLREHSDFHCKANNLSIIENNYENEEEIKRKSMSQNEHYLRRNGKSYKAQIEEIIDNAVTKYSTWDDFVGYMQTVTNFEQRGNNYSITLLENQDRPIRLSSLGVDYSVSSLLFRMENKNAQISKPVEKSFYDVNDSRFAGADKFGLRRWAAKENIKLMSELNTESLKNNTSKEEYERQVKELAANVNNLAGQIKDLDRDISLYEKYLVHHQTFRDSYDLIQGYKTAPDKDAYKKKYYYNFKLYDEAKKYMYHYKDENGKYMKPEAAREKIDIMKSKRADIYSEYRNAREKLSEKIVIVEKDNKKELHQKPLHTD